MDDNELLKNILDWAYNHCHDLWKEYRVQSSPEKRHHLARKILIEKVKKEPETELLISPALKEKILKKEGVDLKRINYEYQEKKVSSKVKQETKNYNQEPGEDADIDGDEIIDVDLFGLKENREKKIINQEPGEDTDIDEDEIINVDLSDQLKREWNKFRWYSIPSIARKLGRHRNSVVYWRDFGIKVNGSQSPIRLKMIKRPFKWYAKGKWIIEFFLKTNGDVDLD